MLLNTNRAGNSVRHKILGQEMSTSVQSSPIVQACVVCCLLPELRITALEMTLSFQKEEGSKTRPINYQALNYFVLTCRQKTVFQTDVL